MVCPLLSIQEKQKKKQTVSAACFFFFGFGGMIFNLSSHFNMPFEKRGSPCAWLTIIFP